MHNLERWILEESTDIFGQEHAVPQFDFGEAQLREVEAITWEEQANSVHPAGGGMVEDPLTVLGKVCKGKGSNSAAFCGDIGTFTCILIIILTLRISNPYTYPYRLIRNN